MSSPLTEQVRMGRRMRTQVDQRPRCDVTGDDPLASRRLGIDWGAAVD